MACVVLKPGASIDANAIRTHCLKFLPLVRTPREIRFSNGLPKTESGKINRQSITVHFTNLALQGIRNRV